MVARLYSKWLSRLYTLPKLKFLKKDLVTWNKEVFGKLNSRISKAIDDLLLTEQATEGRPTPTRDTTTLTDRSEMTSIKERAGERGNSRHLPRVILKTNHGAYCFFEGLGSLSSQEKNALEQGQRRRNIESNQLTCPA
ncbi:hypothetical protein H5410_024706 [Solanum commersonii]|uniref:Uncharacterized protein n=1 Tax=Solanum commersonii TaxID=4109 RepID=A0A9J5ZMP5_SOLCO|nr:hypothetical protein H5410_024706 [Solanum commersonii]